MLKRSVETLQEALPCYFFVCAGDPVAKSGASAGGFVRPPDHSCLAGIEALAHSLPGPRGVTTFDARPV